MPIRDEQVFSDEEMISAFAMVFPPEEAEELGLSFNAMPDLHLENPTAEELARASAAGPRSYDGDLLDLLSLVSDSCAERAWQLLRISPEDGARRRDSFRRRIEEARSQAEAERDTDSK
ncbi:MAG TPA: hypothetical protein VGB92_19250 [Longimicrobium sp.]|jgi:hypothetical protein